MYGRTQALCLENYAKALGGGTVKVRPGSISEFVVLHFMPWLTGRISSDSLSRYDGVWRTHIGLVFGHLKFTELTPEYLQNGINKSGLSPASISLGYSLFSQIIRLAIANGHAEPAHLVMLSITKRPSVKPKARRDIVSAAHKLAALSKGHYMEGPIWVAMTIGLRKGEICGLKISDITEDTLIVRHQRNHTSGDRNQLKHRDAGDEKRIGLPPHLIQKLRSFWNGESVYVFTKPGGQPISYQHFVREMDTLWLGRTLKKGEKRPEGAPTAHDLRSAAIVSLIEAGINDHTIMDLVGHSSKEMIRRYRDTSETRTRDALTKLTGD